jgi:alkylation response protein AidB-like acyl-CoA dehydrogenase
MVTTTSPNEIKDLLPRIRARREEIEQNRKLPQDLVDEMRATGMFRLALPRALGGQEAEPREILGTIEALSAADGSAGWCAMLAITNGLVGGYMRDAGARDVFAEPDAPTAFVFAPVGAATPVAGGIRLTGRWPFASGVTHAGWLMVGCMIMEGGQPRMTPQGPEIVHAAMPVTDAQILDTWYVSGLCGTGSTDVACEDVFIPEHRIFSLFDESQFRPEPLYRMPGLSLVASPVAAVALGIARAALDELTALAPTKTPALSMAPLSEKPVAQVEIARAEGALGAARAYLYETVQDGWGTVCAGEPLPLRQQALIRIAACQATETASRVAHTASTLAGGSAVYNASSFQRHARDADVITHHMTQAQHVFEDAGRALLGLQPQAPVF